ncbi:hypothetical protein ACWD0G_33360, partial [Streptomyces goshikiensis]
MTLLVCSRARGPLRAAVRVLLRGVGGDRDGKRVRGAGPKSRPGGNSSSTAVANSSGCSSGPSSESLSSRR